MIASAHTETLIKETADEAGVNRALIDYYFRSREHFINAVLDEAIAERKAKFMDILGKDVPLQKKIATTIDVSIYSPTIQKKMSLAGIRLS